MKNRVNLTVAALTGLGMFGATATALQNASNPYQPPTLTVCTCTVPFCNGAGVIDWICTAEEGQAMCSGCPSAPPCVTEFLIECINGTPSMVVP
jgi:hypothetical protein